jgi:hypothetical protein
MKTKGALPCQGDHCTRESVSTHVICYRGLRFHLPLCEEHGAELQATEGTEASVASFRASEDVIRITHGQETIAQICYTHSCPAITIAFPEEAPPAEQTEGNGFSPTRETEAESRVTA